ncbi:dihydropteroate synthase [Lutimaribacter sp. EGI FJ00015]|uniref:Dihydropteroate synthase n=1 Tax=Lutimaribacter degradans TaxID=2945989 RepID=A0ACC5ZRD6_9RHOB|nr:dihydropteroate synthase [Lutimaribacter sp. EGI FJ00013]MCM2560715.1 dihydropteroate synthase [Lutimaribacter sp. EGI FJ00013]MCO0612340.1 dihydropteroate synthase [Lutimaribacter sp. EGI FJ00015]MCO0634540.1 dihydropteroate synthase [Lutimaribacter sp. EGI FJ00014]
MSDYFRPLVQSGPAWPRGALPLVGGPLWFTHAEHLRRDGLARVVPAEEIPEPLRTYLSAPRLPVAGMAMERPRLMGILNTTPDSFSDGGLFHDHQTAVAHGRAMIAAGADIIDVGGESTRPGAETVPEAEEIARVAPVITALRAEAPTPISIDTRKAGVARAAMQAGANLINDVAGFTYDPWLAPFAAEHALPVCVMHAQGDPATMQKNPRYDNVLLDVFDFLHERVQTLIALGIPRGRIVVDPGIGFGKTADHNLALLNGISLFHGLGCPVLLGASRKRFIGTIGNAPEPRDRMPGSVAVALAGMAQGVQILRVHDVAETASAMALWQAVQRGRMTG